MINVVQIKRLLAEDIVLAIQEFENQLNPSSDYYNEFLELKGRYNQLKREKDRGLVDYNEYNTEINKLRVSLISMLDYIDKQQNGISTNVVRYDSDEVHSSARIKVKRHRSKLKILFFFALFGIVGVGISKTYFMENYGEKKKVKELLESYYNVLINKEFNSLGKYYSDPVERYYDKGKVYLDDIISDQIVSKKEVEEELVNVDWSSLDIKKTDSHYHVEYKLLYKQKRRMQNWKNYDLRIRVILDSNYRIKSIYEIKEG